MPRKPRPLVAGGIYHLTAHVVPEHDLFQDDRDRQLYLSLVSQVVGRLSWSCTGYCLMDSHIHLVMCTPEPTLDQGMRTIQGRYAQAHNKRLGRRGPVWDGRYGSKLILTEEHYLEVLRYVPLNPVRARATRDPHAWPWSSHAALVGGAPVPPFLDVEAVYRFAGARSGRAGIDAYLSLLSGADRIPESTRAQLTAGRVAPVVATEPGAAPPSGPPSTADLARRHRDEGCSLADLAAEIGCHRSTVLRRIRAHEAKAAAQRV